MAKRKIVQLITTLLYNGNLSGFVKGEIWQNQPKSVCVPGLNCYSCPGALGACPIGSFQATMAGTALKIPFYVLGLITLFGILLGRLICGWMCPFGLVQELLYKIPTPKISKSDFTRKLTSLKYVIGIVFVILLPIYYCLANGVGSPAFCKFICPAGTLEAGIPLAIGNEYVRNTIGLMFGWKALVLAVVVITSIVMYRPFCRFICPLGAFYGFFNKISFFGVKVDALKCTDCKQCIRTCKMDVKCVGDKECINCGECAKTCKFGAISIGKK